MTPLYNQEDTRPVISSGNPELDGKMGGGIPAGTLTLIEGSSGAGKSVLSQQIIWGALQDGFTVSLFTSESTVKSLLRQMNSINLDVLDFLLLGRLRVLPVELGGLGENAPYILLQAIRREMRSDIIAVDSVSAVVSSSTDSAVISLVEGLKRLTVEDISVMLTLHDETIDNDLANTLRSMSDAHLRLRSTQDGQRLVKTLEVAKIRGAASVTGAIVGFDVEPGWGMRVVPISKARG
ncbi:MAG: ATPase domain-containing protein [Chloroflexota bacterium]